MTNNSKFAKFFNINNMAEKAGLETNYVILDSGIHTVEIHNVWCMAPEEGKALSMKVSFTCEGVNMVKDLYLTTKEGETTFLKQNGQRVILNDIKLANQLSYFLGGFQGYKAALEQSTITTHSWSQYGENQTEEVLMLPLSGSISIALTKVRGNKQKLQNNQYINTPEVQEKNYWAFFCRPNDLATAIEISRDSNLGKSAKEFNEKWQGQIDDRYVEVTLPEKVKEVPTENILFD
jgi:hypothetical protein